MARKSPASALEQSVGVASLATIRPPIRLLDRVDAPVRAEPGAPPYEVAFHHGYMLATSGQFAKAIAQFRKAIKLKPDFAEAHYNLGCALVEIGQLPEAVAPFRKASELISDYAKAHYNLGWTLLRTGQVMEAIAPFRKVTELTPDDADAHDSLGCALLKTGQAPEAITAYGKECELKPDDAGAHFGLGLALFKMGQFSPARAAFLKALKANPAIDEKHSVTELIEETIDEEIKRRLPKQPDVKNKRFESTVKLKYNPPVKIPKKEALKSVAHFYGVSVKAADKVLTAARDGAALETTTRRPKGSGDDLNLTPKQVAKVIATSTLGRLQQRYDKLLKINLPPDGLTLKQARLASNLVTTFQNLQKCRRKLGLEPLEKDQKVIDAERLRTAFYSKARKKQATDEPPPRRNHRAKTSPMLSLHR